MSFLTHTDAYTDVKVRMGAGHELPGSDWDYTFCEQNGKTTVRITTYHESLVRMEKMIEMGLKEGFTTSMTNLENLLATLSKK